jgi:hypothetical protein
MFIALITRIRDKLTSDTSRKGREKNKHELH